MGQYAAELLDHQAGRHMLIRRNSGFTLIEMMIVVVIVAILTVIALPSVAEWLQNSRTRSVADSVQNGIRFAQSESARVSRLMKFVSTPTSWSVKVVQITGSSSPIDTMANTVLQQSPSGNLDFVTITPDTSGHTVLEFNDMGRVSASSTETGTFTSLTADASFTVANSKGTRQLTIKVSPAGKVRMCDPDKSIATDPGGC